MRLLHWLPTHRDGLARHACSVRPHVQPVRVRGRAGAIHRSGRATGGAMVSGADVHLRPGYLEQNEALSDA